MTVSAGSKNRSATVFCLLTWLSCSLLQAGGPGLVLKPGVPFRWASEKPIPFSLDRGSLGGLSNDRAAAIMRRAFSEWEGSASEIRFLDLGSLSEDVTRENYPSFFAGRERRENPVVFDSDGQLIEQLLGVGAGSTVLGYAGARYVDSAAAEVLSGWILLNGRFDDPELVYRTALHEIGHFLGLDHSQVGHLASDHTTGRLPVLYPLISSGSPSRLHRDDRAWLNWLYPPSGPRSDGSISGRIVDAAGRPVSGVHVTAVPLSQAAETAYGQLEGAVGTTSGYLENGVFELPGLKAGRYVVVIESLAPQFTGISSVGPVLSSPQVPSEYYSGLSESADEPVDRWFPLEVQAGRQLDGLEVVVNRTSAANENPWLEVPESVPVLPGGVVELTASARDADGDVIVCNWSLRQGLTLIDQQDCSVRLEAPSAWSGETVLVVSAHDLRGRFSQSFSRVQAQKNGQALPASLTADSAGLPPLFVGLAIVNPAVTEAEIRLRSLDPSGRPLPASALNYRLPPLGQDALLTDELPGNGASGATLLVEGEENPLVFFGAGTVDWRRLDGVGGELAAGRRLLFPLGEIGEGTSHLLYIFNPAAAAEASLQLSWLNKEGTRRFVEALRLSPQGTLQTGLTRLFGSQLEEGYLEVSSDQPVQGFVFCLGPQTATASAGLVARPARRLWSPHFSAGEQAYRTELILLNAGRTSLQAEVRIAADEQSVPPLNLSLNAGALQLLDLSRAGLKAMTSGWVGVEVVSPESGELVGLVRFTSWDGRSSSLLPLSSQATRRALFPHVAQSSRLGMYTGFAILNPGTSPALAKLEIYDQSGRRTARAQRLIPPGGRWIELLNGESFDPSFEQLKGHFQISSDQPVVPMALFGDYQGEMLAAIEPSLHPSAP